MILRPFDLEPAGAQGANCTRVRHSTLRPNHSMYGLIFHSFDVIAVQSTYLQTDRTYSESVKAQRMQLATLSREDGYKKNSTAHLIRSKYQHY